MTAKMMVKQLLENGVTNAQAQMYKHNSEVGLHVHFGHGYNVTGKAPEEGEEFVAIWCDDCGYPLIAGIPDVILHGEEANDIIYLYSLE